MIRFLLGMACYLLLSAGAVAQPDTLDAGDTITVRRSRPFLGVVRSYSYHGAQQLAGRQVAPLLRQSPNAPTRRLATRAVRHYVFTKSLNYGAFGAFLGSMATIRQPIAGPLLLSSLLLPAASLIPAGKAERLTERAVLRHNQHLRDGAENPVRPVVLDDPSYVPVLADTVGPLAGRYMRYRGLRVVPAYQLRAVVGPLGDRETSDGLRYSRTVRTVEGLLGGIARTYLFIHLVGYAVDCGLEGRLLPLRRELAVGAVAVSGTFLIGRHANQTQRRAMLRYNDLLRQRTYDYR